MTKITGKNIAVGTTVEDIISAGSMLLLPSTAQIHSFVSDDVEDDYDGILQIETATAAGTIVGVAQVETASAAGAIAGILQVETATVVGTVGASGAGDINVIITGNLVTGNPLTTTVTVANNDSAATVASKIRTALGALTAITDNYTVGGATTNVTLTTIAAAANDATLNIAYNNGTASGLTNLATSTNTTAGHAGTGDATVIVTSNLVTGSPLTINVPVTVGDSPAIWAGKVRTALGVTAITDHYTVSGSGTNIILTANVVAANDSTLNISLANGTSNGIATAATSANTTAGHAGSGNATVIVTSSIVSGSPLTVSVPVVVGDTASTWAGRVRTALNMTTAVTTHFTVSGSSTKIILTAKVAAADDATLNISLADGTSNGITAAPTSEDTAAGVMGTGAKTIDITGIDSLSNAFSENIKMNGTTPVNTTKAYFAINSLRVQAVGSYGKNKGKITATAETDTSVSSLIDVGENKSEQAFYAQQKIKKATIPFFYVSATNGASGAKTTIYLMIRSALGAWTTEVTIVLDEDTVSFTDLGTGLLPEIPAGGAFKVSAVASTGSSSVVVNFNVE